MPTSLLNDKTLSIDESTNKNTYLYIKFTIVTIIGFSLSQLNALGNISPFSVSFVSGLPYEYCLFAFLGSSVGYFVSHSWIEAFRYILALLICAGFRLLVHRKFNVENNKFVCSIVAFCAVLSSGAGYLVLTSLTFETALPIVFESALSLLGTIIFIKSLEIPILSIGLQKLSAQNIFYLVINICILIMSMSGFSVGLISPARIISAIIIIFCAQYKGITASCICSVCLGLSLCIPKELNFMFPLFIISGLVAGVFSSLGQYACAFSFAVCASVITLLLKFDTFELYPIAEVAIASAAYCIIPPKWITNIEEKIEISGLIADEEMDREVCANLERASEKIADVSDIVSRVSEKLDKVINPEINRIFARMQQDICYGCNKKSQCWNKMFSETASDIMTIAGIQSGGALKTGLENRCIRPNALKKEIDNCYDDFVNSMASKIKLSEMRNIVSDQFSSVSQFLSEIANQIRNKKVIDKSKSRSLEKALSDLGFYFDNVFYYSNQGSGIIIEAKFDCDINELDLKKIKSSLEFLTGRKFDREEIAITEDYNLIIYEEKPKYKIQFGYSQIPLAKNKVCGDSIARAYDPCYGEIALISDGMGAGSRAAIDATMTSTLFEKLLSCGFSFESSFKLVNSALMVKSTDESMATVDGLCINIYSGQADFFKAGAAISFIRHKKAITIVEESSLPIGIIRNVSPAYCSVKLEKGDIVLLVSDGVTFGDTSWIDDELLSWTTNSMQDLASHIASMAKHRSDKTNEDDITVVAVKVQ